MPPHVSKLSINRHLPFLDLNVFRGVQGNLEISVYRKPTHTDKYLAFDPHHPICHKKSVAKTLLRRTDCLPSSLDSKAFSVTSKNQLQLVTLLMKGNQRLVLLLLFTFRVLRNPSREFWIATTLKLLKNLFRLRGIFSPNLRILSRKNNEPTLSILFLALTVTKNTSDRPNVSLVHV